jgi:hypothetical protein
MYPLGPFIICIIREVHILFIRFATEEYEPALSFGTNMEVRIVYIFFRVS